MYIFLNIISDYQVYFIFNNIIDYIYFAPSTYLSSKMNLGVSGK